MPNPRPLRVLVVEDNEDCRQSLCLLVGLWGHHCESAAAGPEAVGKAAAFRPDVVLLDIGLPGMDGWRAAREIRKLPELRGAAFVATTGYGRDVDVARSFEEGFAAHLTKPYDVGQLRRMLDGLKAAVQATTSEQLPGSCPLATTSHSAPKPPL